MHRAAPVVVQSVDEWRGCREDGKLGVLSKIGGQGVAGGGARWKRGRNDSAEVGTLTSVLRLSNCVAVEKKGPAS